MKPLKVLLVVLPVLLLTALFVVIRQQRSSAAYLLNQYRVHTPGLRTYLPMVKRWHLEDSTELTGGKKPLLRISTFKTEQKLGAQGGSVWLFTDSFNAANRKKLIHQFPLLPASVQPLPPMENLMVVSFRQSGKWHTRLYDRRSPPAVMEEIDYLMYPKSPKWKTRWKREQQASKVL